MQPSGSELLRNKFRVRSEELEAGMRILSSPAGAFEEASRFGDGAELSARPGCLQAMNWQPPASPKFLCDVLCEAGAILTCPVLCS